MKNDSKFGVAALALFKPLASALNAIGNVVERTAGDAGTASLESLVTLLAAVLKADGPVSAGELREMKTFLRSTCPEVLAEDLLESLTQDGALDVDAAAAEWSGLSLADKRVVMLALIDVAHADRDYTDAERALVHRIGTALGFDRAALEFMEDERDRKHKTRRGFLKSGAGVIAALVVVLIFTLTATFLKSVLFGMILAYLFLPLQRWYERMFTRNAVCLFLERVGTVVMAPFLNVKKRMSGLFVKGKNLEKRDDGESEGERRERRIRLARVNRSCHATVFSLLAGMIVLVLSFGWSSAGYVRGIGTSVKNWADNTIRSEMTKIKMANQGKPPKDGSVVDSLINAAVRKLEGLKPKMEKLPGFEWAKRTMSEYLHDPKNRDSLLHAVLAKSGGVFSFTAGVLGNLAGFVFNAFLTLFFFSFFLQKIASYNSSRESDSIGEYVVDAIFKSEWMPSVDQRALGEARDIIDDILFKLRTWVRSYFTIIIIETIVYVTSFFVLGVPYAPILGFLAGCTILLPFIGPVASCSLTIIVCLAVDPGTSMLFILLVISLYVIMNGVIEQLFLVPALVGESLGLTTLETIIVVLLGGLVAGIPGMIFAVPAVSVLKYLIGKIYGMKPVPEG